MGRHACLILSLSLAAAFALSTLGSGVADAQPGPDRGFVKDKGKAQPKVESKRVALIIGNSDYAEGKLRNSGNDAASMAKALRALGFEVIERHNLDQRELKRAILEFGERLDAESVGLFYYAGHGMQVNGRNYLIPLRAPIRAEQDVEIEAVDVSAVLAKMEAAKNKLNIVILDACRNNPFERSFRAAASGGLAMMDAPNGTLVAYATSPGRTAADGEGANGTYTEALIQFILTPGIRIEDVFKRVRTQVREKTGGQQVPWESSSLEGDFYFTSTAQGSTCPPGTQLKGGQCVALVSTACPEGYKFEPGTGCVPVIAATTALAFNPVPTPGSGRPAEFNKVKLPKLIERGGLNPVTTLGFKDLPILQGSTLVSRAPGSLTFSTTLKPVEVAAYYYAVMERCGGTISGSAQPTGFGYTIQNPECVPQSFSVFDTAGRVQAVLMFNEEKNTLDAPSKGVFGEVVLPGGKVWIVAENHVIYRIEQPVEKVIASYERRLKSRSVKLTPSTLPGQQRPQLYVEPGASDERWISMLIAVDHTSAVKGKDWTLVTVTRDIRKP